MKAANSTSPRSRNVTGQVRQRIERQAERLWRLDDFRDLPFAAVAQALSRLNRQGFIQRTSKGVYYRSRDTAFGKSRPNPKAMRGLAGRRNAMFPSGMAAASHLGFTTQTPSRGEIATSAGSLPMKLVGESTIVHFPPTGYVVPSLRDGCGDARLSAAWGSVQRTARRGDAASAC